jgi:hypothetical protein
LYSVLKKILNHLQIAPFNYVKKMKHYDPAKWPLSATATANPTTATALTSPQANLMVHIPKMREDHLQFSSELARCPTLFYLANPYYTFQVSFYNSIPITHGKYTGRHSNPYFLCP